MGKTIGDSKRDAIILEGKENVLYNIFTNHKTKHIDEASGHIYEERKITSLFLNNNKLIVL